MTTTLDQPSGSVAPTVPPSRGLRACWIVGFGSLALAFPVYTYLVFGSNANREAMANTMAIQATLGYFLGIFAAYLPLPSLRTWTRYERLQATVLPFVICSYITHLTWELGWLILHKPIAGAQDSAWAYAWWNYIDGGDTRYLNPDPHFLMIEVLSVINGCVGLTGLVLLKRSRFTDVRGTLLVMSTAVTHTVLTWYYYGSEIIGGFPSANTSSFIDFGVKFILLNSPWLIAPWFVLTWGYLTLKRQLGRR
ncbi:hypothetical protein EFK50_18135 [Nocardioides marmoriginsengisoli]|uniref:EXPERA domain-containing protein n=1 Tax=Nocardioides marmoriginsengisoli TaxID=661483 RepID=A0A3N0CE50_9ACTN|nr:hypothetical protein [Nocardioides marmoriginsengisoli]RNL61283.1 hypothetical protein EFK50_18135 [Nocardioides marmoriginsengisoli]